VPIRKPLPPQQILPPQLDKVGALQVQAQAPAQAAPAQKVQVQAARIQLVPQIAVAQQVFGGQPGFPVQGPATPAGEIQLKDGKART